MLGIHKMMTVMGKGYQEQDNMQHATCNVQRATPLSSIIITQMITRNNNNTHNNQVPSVDSLKCVPQSGKESGLQPVVW